ncbi:hypothetical protein AB0N73_08020 [Microbacterium sp. NPDC089189]|uniref:hypothetical protein n=1 Tax=Microbacterium sp. NPDC089189 TaxID=3154972 RepID=UPI00342763BC
MKQLTRLETREDNLLDLVTDEDIASKAAQGRLRDIAVERRTLTEKLTRTDVEVRERAEHVLTTFSYFATRMTSACPQTQA